MTSGKDSALFRTSEKELSAIYENVPGIVFYIAVEPDGEFRFLSVSRDFLTATGLSREQVVGSLVRDVIPPPSREMALNRYREAIRSGQPVRWEEESVYPTGQKYGEVAVTPLYDASGLATHLIGIVHDITERKRTEAAARQQAHLLRLSFDAIFVWRFEGGIESWNRGAETLYGFTESEVIGQRSHDLLKTVFPVSCSETEKVLKDIGKWEGELRHRTKDNREVIVSARLQCIRGDEGIVRVLEINRDITERKRLEEKRAEDLLEAAPDAMVAVDQAGRIILVNAQTERLFGYRREEILGRNVEFLIPERFRERHDGHRGKFSVEPRVRSMGAGLELFGLHRDGTEFPVEISLSPIETAEGTLIASAIRDITERKRAEEALRESEERLRLAVQAGRMFAYSWDAATDVIERSGESAQILGVNNDEAATGAAISAMVHPDDKQRLDAAMAKVTIQAPTLQITYRIIRPDGRVVWLERNSRAYFDEHGRVKRIVGMVVDVTERKQTEDKLREYERAVEGAEEMVVVVDREYRYLIANTQFLKMRNMTREQVVGHFAHEVLNAEFFAAVVKPKLDECFQGKVVRYETKYSYPEIGERDIFISYFPIEGNMGIDRAACILQDITDRKRSQESLRESEQRFRLAAQAGKMYSFEWDVTTDVVVRSPERVKVLGGTEPLPIRHQQFMDTIYPEDRPKFVATIAGLTPQSPTAEIIYRVPAADGSLIWLKSSGRAHFNSEGKMLRVIGMVADISDLKRAEDALAGMTRKLIEAQEQERARIGRELHDDINQRIAMLSLELEQLQENPSELQNRVQELRKSMAELSNDVQALSHDLHSSKLEYLGVVAGMKSWCKEFAERQKLEIDFRSDASSVLPLQVGLTLFRVLQEALNNAIKHSGVKRIEVQLREDSSEIHLIISDLGRGFDVETASQGKGLGLTSMRERIRLVNGTISIESKLMGGTTIHVRVPLGSEHGAKREAG